MVVEKIYSFKPTDFDKDGFHETKSEYLFLYFVHDCEKDFHERHIPFFANALCANNNTLSLIKSCLHSNEKEIYGMESVDGNIDIEMNIEIDKHSTYNTVYAIGSAIQERDDEAIFLIIDDTFSDKQFSLKYIPDNEPESILENMPDPKKIKILSY